MILKRILTFVNKPLSLQRLSSGFNLDQLTTKMISGYTYKAFGLTINSELECPELQASTGKADVSIQLGVVPKSLENPLFVGVRFQTTGNEFLLLVDKVARYHVLNGEQITIEILENADVDDVRLFLLGSAFGALIHQRGLLPIHGSAIEIEQSAIIFSGHSGAGKSTIAAAFYKQDFPILSDDVSVLSLSSEGIPIVHPGYPQMKLWSDSILKLGDEPSLFPNVRKQLDKHNIRVSNRFCEQPLPLKKIYIIASRNLNKLEMIPVKGVEKFSLLRNHTYRFNFIAGAQMRTAHFRYIDALAKHVDVIKILRPNGKFLFDEIINLVLQDLRNER